VCFVNDQGTSPAKRAKTRQRTEIALLITHSATQSVSPKVFRFVTVRAGLFCCVRSRLAATFRLFYKLAFGTPHALRTTMNSEIVLPLAA